MNPMDTAPADALRLTVGFTDDLDREWRIMRVVERWHNETHTGGFRLCREQPCYAAQRA